MGDRLRLIYILPLRVLAGLLMLLVEEEYTTSDLRRTLGGSDLCLSHAIFCVFGVTRGVALLEPDDDVLSGSLALGGRLTGVLNTTTFFGAFCWSGVQLRG